MFRHLLPVLLSPLAGLAARLLRDDRDRQIPAVRQQVLILKRQLGRRWRLTDADKLAALLTCVRMRQRQLLYCLMIVKPGTLVAWHRQTVRRHWAFPPQRRPGRPRTAPQAEQFTAYELQRHPQQISGATVPILRDGDTARGVKPPVGESAGRNPCPC